MSGTQFEQLKKKKNTGSSKKKDEVQGNKDQGVGSAAGDEAQEAQAGSLVPTESIEQERSATPPPYDKTASKEANDPVESTTKTPHTRQPSLSVESRMRSTSFRRTSNAQVPLSPTLAGTKSPILQPFSPEGESVNEIYRKQTARLDELERENKRLAKETREFETRWKKSLEELEDLRDANAEIVELKSVAKRFEIADEEVKKLVETPFRPPPHVFSYPKRSPRLKMLWPAIEKQLYSS